MKASSWMSPLWPRKDRRDALVPHVAASRRPEIRALGDECIAVRAPVEPPADPGTRSSTRDTVTARSSASSASGSTESPSATGALDGRERQQDAAFGIVLHVGVGGGGQLAGVATALAVAPLALADGHEAHDDRRRPGRSRSRRAGPGGAGWRAWWRARSRPPPLGVGQGLARVEEGRSWG